MQDDIYILKNLVSKYPNYHPGISLDCVVFGYKKEALHILLLKSRSHDLWALPSGFLGKEEELEEAVGRIMFERTGLKNVFLKQFHIFSSVNRTEGNRQFDGFTDELPADLIQQYHAWFDQRFLTTGFLALINPKRAKLQTDLTSSECAWLPILELPSLFLDHEEIIQKAMDTLQQQIQHIPVGKSLLPKKFTMRDLQKLYEAILQKKLDRGNFQRKMLKLDVLIRHDKLMTGAANKAPYLYSFDSKKYKELLEEGMWFL
ncbi:MAG: NUDIX domain-containing protein [Saprospiraceae bacterium]|nr:NUDIX domain-containing protein [Saprospiraceae bacterium]